jgi:acyl carrier protein
MFSALLPDPEAKIAILIIKTEKKLCTLTSFLCRKCDFLWKKLWRYQKKVVPLQRKFIKQISFTTKNFKVMSEVADKVKAIIVDKLGVDESEVTPQASFTNDLGADSLDTVELIMEFEKAFGITIPDDQAEKISTVGEAIAHIEGAVK